MSDELSLKNRAVLLTLMAEVRPIANSELRRRGLALTPADRQNLEGLSLITTTTAPGRRHTFELSDEGWEWCERQLAAPVPDRPGPAGQALYALLSALGRHLVRVDGRLNEVFRPDHDAAVVSTYRGLAAKPGDHVLLSRVRAALPDVLREDLDAALLSLSARSGVHLVPESNQQALTTEDRDAAFQLAGQDRHLIAIEGE